MQDLWDYHFRINRNILECKWQKPVGYAETEEVLIETYWNVNDDPKPDDPKSDSSINRNILECK